MRKSVVRSLATLGFAAAVACSSHTDDDLSTQLQKDTGVAWAVSFDPRSNAPRVLLPATPVKVGAGSPEADARTFFAKYGNELGTAAHELRVTVDEAELGGGHYVRFQHYIKGSRMRVFEVVSMAHFDADGRMYIAQPGFRPGLDAITHDAKLSADEAIRAAAAAAVTGCGASSGIAPTDPPELGVAADEDQPYALAYRVKFSLINEQCLAPEFDINATTGAVIRMHAGALAYADSAPGTRYYLSKEKTDIKPLDVSFDSNGYRFETESSPKVVTRAWSRTANGNTEGTVFVQATPGNWDSSDARGPGAAVDAHYSVTNALRYFSEMHGRHGVDGNNGEMDVFVHDNTLDDTGGGGNAQGGTTVSMPYLLFFSQKVDAVFVGDGDYWQAPDPHRTQMHYLPFSAAFEIMTHEVAHGVTKHTSGLENFAEAGALNESFSDVMGVSADQWLSPERYGDPTRLVMGNRVTIDGKGFTRDMLNPESSAQSQVTRTSDMKSCTSDFDRARDNCDTHANSGISNRAWSLMTLGGTHAQSHVKVTEPMGFEAARVLWYETFTRLPSQPTFTQAALSQVAWAWTYDQAHFTTVVCAWMAVGAIPSDESLRPTLQGIPLSMVSCQRVESDAGATSPPPPSPTPSSSSSPCAGKSDSWVCDPNAPSSAYNCNSGTLTNTVTCSDTALTCKPRSASDPTANVDDTGVLDCE